MLHIKPPGKSAFNFGPIGNLTVRGPMQRRRPGESEDTDRVLRMDLDTDENPRAELKDRTFPNGTKPAELGLNMPTSALDAKDDTVHEVGADGFDDLTGRMPAWMIPAAANTGPQALMG
jgi:hypothetical protein